MARQVPIGVLISGGGTNLQAIIDAIEARRLDATIKLVLSNKADAYGLTRARNHGIPTEVLDHKKFRSREAYDQAIVDLLRARGAELVALAGFMRLLSPVFVKAYSNRIMNIHPALLPSFPGLRCKRKPWSMGCVFPAAPCISSTKSATRGRLSSRLSCQCSLTTRKKLWRRGFSSRNTASTRARSSSTPKTDSPSSAEKC
jgi:hypothetical protein